MPPLIVQTTLISILYIISFSISTAIDSFSQSIVQITHILAFFRAQIGIRNKDYLWHNSENNMNLFFWISFISPDYFTIL